MTTRLTPTDRIELLLMAARAPQRTKPEQALLEGEAFHLLCGRNTVQWTNAAIAANICPSCCWPATTCPECKDDDAPYCANCDQHLEYLPPEECSRTGSGG